VAAHRGGFCEEPWYSAAAHRGGFCVVEPWHSVAAHRGGFCEEPWYLSVVVAAHSRLLSVAVAARGIYG
jgi:hypothetical protein